MTDQKYKVMISRDLRLDAIRGLMLIIMAIYHYPHPLMNYVEGALGYVTAAKGFVFLSGYLAGMIYTRTLLSKGMNQMVRKARNRVGTIYLYHICAFIIAFLIVFSSTRYSEPFSTWMPLLQDHPITAIMAGLLLVSRPAFLDVLPMFCMFLFCAPLALVQLQKGRFWLVSGGSFTIWLLSQAGLTHWLANKCNNILPVYWGYFDVFAWQFLYMLGLIIGWRTCDREIKITQFTAWKFSVAWLLAAVFFAFRHNLLPFSDRVGTDWLINKSTLGPLRLAKFFVLATLISQPQLWPNTAWWVKALSFLGRNSLVVFSYHIVLMYVLFLVIAYHPVVSDIANIVIALFCTATLYLPALVREWIAFKRWYKPHLT